LIEIGSKTAEKNSAQTDRHYENNGHLAVNQLVFKTGNYSVVRGEWRILQPAF